MANSTNIRKKDSEILAARTLQVQRGGARAAVLGVNDGLVSTLCLVLAVAAAGSEPNHVLLAGFAGLIAGAVSMAAGEWISVKAQVELFQGVLSDLKRMVKNDRILLEDNLADAYTSNGLSVVTAQKAAHDIAGEDKHLFRLYATQVLGLNPDELGSPWVAAGSSFALFTIGALVPLMPWLFVSGQLGIALSVLFTGLGGLITGGYVANSSGKSVAYGSLRQLIIIVLAASVTYGAGYLFGVTVA